MIKPGGIAIKNAATVVNNKVIQPGGKWIKDNWKDIAIEAGIDLGTAALSLIPGGGIAAAALQVGARIGKTAATVAKVAKTAVTAAKGVKSAENAIKEPVQAAKAGMKAVGKEV